jgi:hypothetical protein
MLVDLDQRGVIESGALQPQSLPACTCTEFN